MKETVKLDSPLVENPNVHRWIDEPEIQKEDEEVVVEETKQEEKDELTASLVEEEKFDDDFEDEPEKKSDDSSVKVIVNPMADYIYETIQNESDDSLMTGSADTFPTETETETINDKVEPIAEDEMVESTVFVTQEKTPEEQSKEETVESPDTADVCEVVEEELEPVEDEKDELVESEEPVEKAEPVEVVETDDMIKTEEMVETNEVDQLDATDAHVADDELDVKSEATEVADEIDVEESDVVADGVVDTADVVDAVADDTDENKDEFRIADFEPSPRAIVSEETGPSGMTSEIVLEPHIAQTPLLDQALDSEVIDENEIYNIVNEVDQLVNQITSVSDNVEIISDEVQTFTDVIGDIESSIKKSLSGEIHQSSGSESPVTEGPDEISDNEDEENGIDVESVTVADVIDDRCVEADSTNELPVADKQLDSEAGPLNVELDTIVDSDDKVSNEVSVDNAVADEPVVEVSTVEPSTEASVADEVNIDEQVTTSFAPATDEQETEEPVPESSNTMEPTAESSVVEESVTDDAKIEEQVADESVTVEADVDEPEDTVVEETIPVDETNQEPVVEDLVVAEEPTAVESSTDKPLSEEPITVEPVATESVTEEPTSVESIADETQTDKKTIEQSVNEDPLTEEPVTVEPVSEEAITKNSVLESLVTEEAAVEGTVIEETLTEVPVSDEIPVDKAVNNEPAIDEPVAQETEAGKITPETSVTEKANIDNEVDASLVEEQLTESSIVEEPVSDIKDNEEPFTEEPVIKSNDESPDLDPEVNQASESADIEVSDEVKEVKSDSKEGTTGAVDASPIAQEVEKVVVLSETVDQIEAEKDEVEEPATPAKSVTFEDEATPSVENVITVQETEKCIDTQITESEVSESGDQKDTIDQMVDVLSDDNLHIETVGETNLQSQAEPVQESAEEIVDQVVVETSAPDVTQSEDLSNKMFVSPTGEVDAALMADVIVGEVIAEQSQVPTKNDAMDTILNEVEPKSSDNLIDDSADSKDVEANLVEDKPENIASDQPVDDESNEPELEAAKEVVELPAETNPVVDSVSKDNVPEDSDVDKIEVESDVTREDDTLAEESIKEEGVTIGDQIDQISSTEEPALLDDETNIKSDDIVVDNETRSNSEFETCATSLTEKDEDSPCVTGDNIDDEDEVQVATNESDKYERVINGELTENTDNDISSTALDDSEKHFESKLDAVSDVSDIEEMTDTDAVCDTIVNQLANDQSVIENQATIEQTKPDEKHEIIDSSPVSVHSELRDSSPDIITEELTASSKTDYKPVEEEITVTTHDEPPKCTETEQHEEINDGISDIAIDKTTDINDNDCIDQETAEPVIVNEGNHETNLEVESQVADEDKVNDSTCDNNENNDIVTNVLEQNDTEEPVVPEPIDETAETKVETESTQAEGEEPIVTDAVVIDGAEVELASGKLLEEILKASDEVEVDVEYKTDANAEATENDISSAAFDDSYLAEQSIKSRQLDATIVSDTSDVDEMTDTDATEGVCATIDEESEPNTKTEEVAKEPSSSSENDSLVFKKLEKDLVAPIAQSTPKSPIFMDDVLGGLNNQEREVQREEKSPVESESNGTDTTSVATTVLPVNEKQEVDDMDSSSVLSHSEVDNSTTEIKGVEVDQESVTQDDEKTVDETKTPVEPENVKDDAPIGEVIDEEAVDNQENVVDDKVPADVNETADEVETETVVESSPSDVAKPIDDEAVSNEVSEEPNDIVEEEVAIESTSDNVESNLEEVVEAEPYQNEVTETESKTDVDTETIVGSTETLVESPEKDMVADEPIEVEEHATNEQTVETDISEAPVEEISETVDDIIDAIADADPVAIAETLTDSVIQDLNQVNEIMDSPVASANSSEKLSEVADSVDAVEVVEAAEPAETTKAVESTEPVEAVEKVEAAEKVDAAEIVEAVETVDATETVEAAGAVEVVETTESVETVEAEHAELTDVTEEAPEQLKTQHVLEQSIDVVDDVVEHSREITTESTGLVVIESICDLFEFS